jgi:hypothetical protein
MNMIDALDEVLEQLLIRELPIKNGEVDIAFDQPVREWSSRLNRPTLNLFLYDIRENETLRQPRWDVQRRPDGTSSKRRSAMRVDLRYMITAWTTEPEDEHRLLSLAMMAFFRTPILPEDLLPEILQDQPVPIPIRIGLHDVLTEPADIWNTLDNEMRPAVSCLITLALNPFQTFTGPLVKTRELYFGLADELPDVQRLDGKAGEDRFWMVGGQLRSKKPLDEVELKLLERSQTVPVRADGDFILGNLAPGDYTLELSIAGGKPKKHTITVPSESYDIDA